MLDGSTAPLLTTCLTTLAYTWGTVREDLNRNTGRSIHRRDTAIQKYSTVGVRTGSDSFVIPVADEQCVVCIVCVYIDAFGTNVLVFVQRCMCASRSRDMSVFFLARNHSTSRNSAMTYMPCDM